MGWRSSRWSLILAMVPASARAGMGAPGLPPLMLGTQVSAGGPDSTCQILVRGADGHVKWCCSGTLTDKQYVTTAGHCVAELDPATDRMSVQCGFEGTDPTQLATEQTDSGGTIYTRGVRFKETHSAVEFNVAKNFSPTTLANDVAILRLDEKSAIPPMRLATPSDLPTYFPAGKPAAGVQCRTAGFGYSREKTMGLLNSAPVASSVRHSGKGFVPNFATEGDTIDLDDPSAATVRDLLTQRPSDWVRSLTWAFDHLKGAQQILGPGDSGGPLYCRKGQGPWEVFAVNSWVDYQLPDGTTKLTHRDYWASTELSQFESLADYRARMAAHASLSPVTGPATSGEAAKPVREVPVAAPVSDGAPSSPARP